MKISISNYSANANKFKSFTKVYENSNGKLIAINLPFNRFLLIKLK